LRRNVLSGLLLAGSALLVSAATGAGQDALPQQFGAFALTDEYALTTVDLCSHANGVESSEDVFSRYGVPLDELPTAIVASFPHSFEQVQSASVCCICTSGTHWWQVKCVIMGATCCCQATISPTGGLKCLCASGACPTRLLEQTAVGASPVAISGPIGEGA
jgi:hypothetical protein